MMERLAPVTLRRVHRAHVGQHRVQHLRCIAWVSALRLQVEDQRVVITPCGIRLIAEQLNLIKGAFDGRTRLGAKQNILLATKLRVERPGV